MANTVNDVMNVIASPDYGIKNIAGTNQEILAILQGTHNSQNNIHNIVDDVRNLLQELVTTATSNKPVEVDSSSIKINKKHIQDILDETKGIRKAIINLEKSIIQQGKGSNAGVVKLSDKASEKVADAMAKNIEKQNKGGGLSSLVDAFNKLKEISLKDIISGNFKIKKLMKVFKDAKKDLNINEKELKSLINIVNAAPEMIKALSKVSWRINLIIKNNIIKKLSDIIVGKDSLLSISQLLQENGNIFDSANKVSKNIIDITSHLNNAMLSLLFASMWAKSASSGIKSIDEVLEKLIPLATKLTKNKKDINEGTKVSKNIKSLAGNLLVTSLLLAIGAANAITATLGATLLNKMVDKISSIADTLIKNKKNINEGTKVSKNIKSLAGNLLVSSIFLSIGAIVVVPAIIGSLLLNIMVDSVVYLANNLIKNKKDISAGANIAKNIENLISSLNTSMMKLSVASVSVKSSSAGIKSVKSMVDKLIPLVNKLDKNSKNIENGTKAAKNINSLVGNLLTTSLLLTIAAITGIPAVWGTKQLSKMINKILPTTNKLAKNNKNIENGTKAAKNITVLVGNLLISSILLTIGAATGIFALLGTRFLDEMVNDILPISNKLAKNNKDIKDGTKAAKNITALVGNLLITSIFLTIAAVTGIFAGIGAKRLSEMVEEITPIINNLIKNKKDINAATKVAKNITALVGNLLITSIFLTIAAVTGIPAILGAILLDLMLDSIINVSKKLSKNNKDINKSTKAARKLMVFTGLMALTSLFLATIAVTGIPALLGAVLMLGIVKICSLTFNMLNKAKKNALIGSLVLLVMSASLILFGIALKKIVDATKDVKFKQVGVIVDMTLIFAGVIIGFGVPAVAALVALGSLTMMLMSTSLIIFGTALGKIAKATKSLEMKHITLVASSMMILGLGIAAMGFLSLPVLLGSIALGATVLALNPFVNVLGKIAKISEKLKMEHIKLVNSAMMELALGITVLSPLYLPVIIGSATVLAIGVGLKPFVNTLGLIAKATENLEMKHIKLVNQAMVELALGIAVMSSLYLPVMFGSATVFAIGVALRPFIKTLKIISDMGSVPTRLVRQIIKSIEIVGNFFKYNEIDSDVVKNAKRYKKVMKPFISTVSHLSKLKEIGTIPTKLVLQTLKAMRTIANYYIENPIERKVIKQARRYKRMMRPFGHMVEHLSKLKQMGSIPIKLVQQTLKAMRTIANYYIENPIERKVIKQARRYKRMMRPFGHMVEHLSKLKQMGSIPIKLVQQTLKAMRTIANYYLDNPIERKVIKQARRYKRMLRPFGKTIDNLSKLKQMGSIPIKLVRQTLSAMSEIAKFYLNQDISSSDGEDAEESAEIISGIITNFGKALDPLKGLKYLRNVPTEAIQNAVNIITNITWFYKTADFKDMDTIKETSRLTKFAVKRFINMAISLQDNFKSLERIDLKAITYIIYACRSIINYYQYTKFSTPYVQIIKMNSTVKSFAENIQYIKNIDFNLNNFMSIGIALKSMKQIIRFLKNDTLNSIQRKKANKNISLLSRMASAMSDISNINTSSMSSIGGALTDALSGVNTIDMGQVVAVTNMFNAFNKISKSENIINKFTESVKEFTETCKDLMDAMGNNTDAINNIDMSGNRNSGSIFSNIKDKVYDFVSGESDNNTNQTNGIRITNVDEVARAIAEKINGALSVDVPDAQIQLLINGTGGNEWTISRY